MDFIGSLDAVTGKATVGREAFDSMENAVPGVTEGTIPAVEHTKHVQEELVNLIVDAGIDPSSDDLTQVTEAVKQLIAQAELSSQGEEIDLSVYAQKSRKLTAGHGLGGGGNLEGDRDFYLDFGELQSITSLLNDASVIINNIAGVGNKPVKIPLANFRNIIIDSLLGRKINSGLGLSGGGSLSADRTLNMAFNELPTRSSMLPNEYAIINSATGNGNDPAKITSTNFLKTNRKTSGNLPYRHNTSWAHGLGSVPKSFGAAMVCKRAVHGYGIGDRVNLSGPGEFSGVGQYTIRANSTTVSLGLNGIRLHPTNSPTAIIPSVNDWDVAFWAER